MMQGYDPFAWNPLGASGDTYAPPEIAWFDWSQTVISQYANSPVILAMIEAFSGMIDPSADLELFYNDIWDITTAYGHGLDVWGRILGVGRVLQLPSAEDFFGFEESEDGESFNTAPMFRGISSTDNYALSDSAYRVLLYAKAAANITDGSIASANAILRTLFPNHGNCYMRDNEDMSITWVFGAPLSPVENSIVRRSGVLPKPAGVSATVEVL